LLWDAQEAGQAQLATKADPGELYVKIDGVAAELNAKTELRPSSGRNSP
jgi:hypothetical protein